MSPRTKHTETSVPTLREPRYSHSLERGLAILCTFTPEQPELGISDIADELEMSRSTTHRYVITLVALGYLEQDSSRKYRLSTRVTDLGMVALASTGLPSLARSHMRDLSQRTGGTVSLGMLDGPEVVCLEQVHRSRQRGRTNTVTIGARAAAHCSAMGKVLLAHLPAQDRDALITEMRLQRCGPNTITTKRALREELETILLATVAIDDQELTANVYSIAAPLHNHADETIAAIEIAVPSAAMSLAGIEEALAPHLLAAADLISARLGYRRGGTGRARDLTR